MSDKVVVERRVTLVVDGARVAELYGSPAHFADWAIGHLFCLQRIARADDVQTVTVRGLEVEVELRPGAAGGPVHRGDVRVTASQVIELMASLLRGAPLHRRTGGTHCAGIAVGGRIVVAREDVGRHNAIDKAIGAAVCGGIDLGRSCLVTTGRVNRETAHKAIRSGCPVVASRSAPTDAAVDALDREGVTLVGFVRSDRLNVYTHPRRIG